MSPIYCFQFLLFSCCVHVFTVISYFVFYSNRLFSLTDLKPQYDYIIVGSGTAGSVIAQRLAKETNHSFIVLEAGANGHTLLEMPVIGPFLHRSVFDWKFESVPQKYACWAMEGNKCRLPQGKIVGGSSKINNMIHVRGNISHYLVWFNGRHSKEYIEKQFENLEKYVISIDKIQYESELSKAVLEAAEELGYRILSKDFKEGFAESRVSQKNGKRWATSDNLLPDRVISNAFVENVIFAGNTAVGVNVNLFSKNFKVLANKGVILSAGTINTPKILQLSGVGPENVLKSLGIPIVKVLPVGKNLQDHIATGLDLVLFNQSVSIQAFDMINPVHVFQYLFYGKGPMTTTGCEAIGFVSTKNDSVPDIQFMVLPVGLSTDRGSLFSKNLGVKEELWQKYFSKNVDKYTSTILPIILHPKSKGEVFIASTDPKEPPVFDPNYLSRQEDIETLIKGLKIMIKLIKTKAFQNIGAYLNPVPFPGCEGEILFSDSYFECYIRHLTLTSYHPVGTCSMGSPDSKISVVDSSFKVLGLEKLYVADASVLPTLPSGNINAAVAMMGSVFFDTNIGFHTKENKHNYCSKRSYLNESLNHFCAIMSGV